MFVRVCALLIPPAEQGVVRHAAVDCKLKLKTLWPLVGGGSSGTL